MPGKSDKSTKVEFRLDNATYQEIARVVQNPRSNVDSVNLYCKQAVQRYAWRYKGGKPNGSKSTHNIE